ncbi:MAG: DsbA family protein, partial [Planctomycetota bacterium]
MIRTPLAHLLAACVLAAGFTAVASAPGAAQVPAPAPAQTTALVVDGAPISVPE